MNLLRTVTAGALLFLLVACGGSSGQSSDASAPGKSSVGSTAKPSGPVAPLPFNAGGLLAGTAAPNFSGGEQGKVSVVQVGALDEHMSGSAKLPFAFRNNTSEGVSHVDWSGTARSGGAIVATGSSQGTVPTQVKPGEVGLAFIYFDGTAKLPPADAEYEFTVTTSPADQDGYNTAPLKVTEANSSGDAIVGAAVNQTGESVEGPFSVDAYCFDGDKVLSEHGDFAEQDGPISADGQVTFSASLYGANCPTFVVGAGGYFSE
ncbi:MAG TPA: hypothetical protein VGP27_10430 [Mycobacterium sp.]|nr:hypothetical protein [Mycobacterium sp.]